MPYMTSYLIGRLYVYTSLIILSSILIAITAAAFAQTPSPALAFSLATSCVTLLVGTGALTAERVRRGLYSATVSVELILFALLWLLWVASVGAVTATMHYQSSGVTPSQPAPSSGPSNATSSGNSTSTNKVARALLAAVVNATTSSSTTSDKAVCPQPINTLLPTIQSFSLLIFFLGLVWFFTLLTCTIITLNPKYASHYAPPPHHSSIWRTPVVEHPWFTGDGKTDLMVAREKVDDEEDPFDVKGSPMLGSRTSAYDIRSNADALIRRNDGTPSPERPTSIPIPYPGVIHSTPPKHRRKSEESIIPPSPPKLNAVIDNLMGEAPALSGFKRNSQSLATSPLRSSVSSAPAITAKLLGSTSPASQPTFTASRLSTTPAPALTSRLSSTPAPALTSRLLSPSAATPTPTTRLASTPKPSSIKGTLATTNRLSTSSPLQNRLSRSFISPQPRESEPEPEIQAPLGPSAPQRMTTRSGMVHSQAYMLARRDSVDS